MPEKEQRGRACCQKSNDCDDRFARDSGHYCGWIPTIEKYGCVESGIVEFGDRLLPIATGDNVGSWRYLYVLRKVCQETCSKAFEEGYDLHFTGRCDCAGCPSTLTHHPVRPLARERIPGCQRMLIYTKARGTSILSAAWWPAKEVHGANHHDGQAQTSESSMTSTNEDPAALAAV